METKILLLNNEGWKQQVAVSITSDEQDVLANINEENKESALAIINKIKNGCFVEPTTEDIAAAQAIYDINKLNDSKLISANVSLPAGNGIINCLVNGEHKQIRF